MYKQYTDTRYQPKKQQPKVHSFYFIIISFVIIQQITFNFIIIMSLVSFPIVSRKSYTNDSSQFVKLIDKMYRSYHDQSFSLLEDMISFSEESEFLKRIYEEYQYANKINMLSEYYQYHKELPRIFQRDISDIIQIYQQDVRNMEYKFVTKKMKEGSFGDNALTNREKSHRPVDKIIKNIELSYYNFQNKDVKKCKENPRDKHNRMINLNKNKKSMPALPLYQYNNNKIVPKNNQISNNHKVPPQPQPLKVKDINKLTIKSKSKDQPKKLSSNDTSVQSPRNLSRSKSKSNLAGYREPFKRNSVKPFQEVLKHEKPKSNPTSLQKTVSHKNILKRQEPKKNAKPLLVQKSEGKICGMKNMFKKIMQTKMVIKIAR